MVMCEPVVPTPTVLLSVPLLHVVWMHVCRADFSPALPEDDGAIGQDR